MELVKTEEEYILERQWTPRRRGVSPPFGRRRTWTERTVLSTAFRGLSKKRLREHESKRRRGELKSALTH